MVAQKIVQPKDRLKNSQPNYAKDYGPLGECSDRKPLNRYFDDLGKTIDQINNKYGGNTAKQIQSNTNNNSINSDSNNNLGNVSIADPGGTVASDGDISVDEDRFQQCGACCCNYALGQMDCRHVDEDQIRTLSKHKELSKVITHIYLSDNNIERMPSYEYILTSQFSMTRLRELWLMNNNIRRLELSKIHHLRSSLRLLSAANNKIASVEPPNEPFSRLLVLDLPDNELTSVNFLRKSGFESLTNISFSNNRIQRIETNTFGRLKNLRELVLSNNKLQSLDYQAFDNLENLRTLDLSNNRILYLQGAQFEGQMPQLIKLDLRGNNLQSVHAAAFKGLNVLLELDLSENRLTSVSFDVFQPFITVNNELTLSQLDLAYNPLVCSCPDMKLISLLSDFRSKVKNPSKLICQFQDETKRGGAGGHDHNSHDHGQEDEKRSYNQQKRMIDLEKEDVCAWELFSDIKDFVVIPVAIFGGIVGLVVMFCLVSRLVGKGSIAGSSRASFIDSSSGSKDETSLQNLQSLPTMSMLHYPNAPNMVPLEIPAGAASNGSDLHLVGDWAEKKTYPAVSGIGSFASNLDNVPENTALENFDSKGQKIDPSIIQHPTQRDQARASSCKPPSSRQPPVYSFQANQHSASISDFKNFSGLRSNSNIKSKPYSIKNSRSTNDAGYGSRGSSQSREIGGQRYYPHDEEQLDVCREKREGYQLEQPDRYKSSSSLRHRRRRKSSKESSTTHSSLHDSNCSGSNNNSDDPTTAHSTVRKVKRPKSPVRKVKKDVYSEKDRSGTRENRDKYDSKDKYAKRDKYGNKEEDYTTDCTRTEDDNSQDEPTHTCDFNSEDFSQTCDFSTSCNSYTEDDHDNLKTEMVDSTENYASSDDSIKGENKLRKARSKSTIIAIKREVSMRSTDGENNVRPSRTCKKDPETGDDTKNPVKREHSCKKRKKSCRRRTSVKKGGGGGVSRSGSCKNGNCDKTAESGALRRRRSSVKEER